MSSKKNCFEPSPGNAVRREETTDCDLVYVAFLPDPLPRAYPSLTKYTHFILILCELRQHMIESSSLVLAELTTLVRPFSQY